MAATLSERWSQIPHPKLMRGSFYPRQVSYCMDTDCATTIYVMVYVYVYT